MVICDRDIKRLCELSPPLVTPFTEECLQPASYDVHLGDHFIIHRARNTQDYIYGTSEFNAEKPFRIYPGDFVLATTVETVNIPNDMACELRLKSTAARQGLSHALAVWIDPGFRGEITMELNNIGNREIVLYPGSSIAQLIFLPVCTVIQGGEDSGLAFVTEVNKSYDGRYQDQTGATEARDVK